MIKYLSNASDKLLLLALTVLLLLFALFRTSGNLQGTIWSDSEGYYAYLPAVFIQHNVTEIKDRSVLYEKNVQGKNVDRYTCGLSFFFLPFFLIGHSAAMVLGYPITGYSPPYIYAIICCGVFWGMVGVSVLLLLLQKYFGRDASWLAVLAVTMGTNFFYYVTKWMAMSHIYNFTLVAAILYLTDKYYDAPKTKYAICIALLIGWLILIRPTNCIFVLFLVLYKITSIASLRSRLLFIRQHLLELAAASLLIFVPIFPQLLYWKVMVGKWFYYAYRHETFSNWQHPKVLEVLFDTQNGLFLYAPILLLAPLGWWLLRKQERVHALAGSIIFAFITYIFASWWAWWFGGDYGHRCYIDYLPVLAFPIAGIYALVAKQKWVVKYTVGLLCVTLVYYNVALTFINDHAGIWDGDGWRWNYDMW